MTDRHTTNTTPALTPEREAEIRAAHPGYWYAGPWYSEYVDGRADEPASYRVVHQESGTTLATLPDWAGPLAAFIADAHDAGPELLDEVERLRNELTVERIWHRQAARTTAEHGPLWSLLDWSLWGAGMGDTFREPLADTMLAAVPTETVTQAEAVMAEFIERRGIEKTGVTVYQEQRDELERLRARVAELEQQAAEQRATVLTEAEQHLRGLAVAHLDSGCDFCNGVDWAADKVNALAQPKAKAGDAP